MLIKRFVSVVFGVCIVCVVNAQLVTGSYVNNLRNELVKTWPHNRTINIVFHGHSVPSGYANTPVVNTLGAYPHLTLHAIKEHYPYAVVNVITTSIGGEQSEQGEKRFKKEVLTHRPDLLFIDYALNDRSIGLERSLKAWEKMIKQALKQDIKIVLMTPTPDLTENILDENTPLAKHAQQIRDLASKYHLGLVDSYAMFKDLAKEGKDLREYMSQSNHPNAEGHKVVLKAIEKWFVSR